METGMPAGTALTRIALLSMAGIAVTGIVVSAAGHTDAALVLALTELDVLWVTLVSTGIVLHRSGVPVLDGWRRIARSLPPAPVRRAIASEVRLLGAFLGAVTFRPLRIPPGALPISSARGTLPVPLALTVLTLLEVAALHVVIPWPAVSLAVTLLSVYSLVLFLGHMALRRQHPHYITESSLVLRNGPHPIVTVPLDDIEAVTVIDDVSATSPTVDGDIARVATLNGCSIAVRLRSRQLLRLTGSRRASAHMVSEIRFAADDAQEVSALLLAGAAAGPPSMG